MYMTNIHKAAIADKRPIATDLIAAAASSAVG